MNALERSLATALASPDGRKAGLRELDKLEWEDDLYSFFAAAWPSFDPAPFQGNWHLEAIAEHLQAVTDGDVRKLIINIGPRHGKTLLTSVAWPAWTWARRKVGPLSGAQVKFLCLTYGDDFALHTATTAKRLIMSPWYQQHWGDSVRIAKDRDAKEQYDTTVGGSRISTSFGGATLGKGGDIKLIDDPHKVKEVESDVVRQGVIQTYDEALRSRVTDPRHTATVCIMHRLHTEDLAGHLLEEGDWTHLCLPTAYDPARHCTTSWYSSRVKRQVTWNDPRTEEGELLWGERWSAEELAQYQSNSYLWAGQYQQLPVPRGGGIFRAGWWKPWPPDKAEMFDSFGSPIKPLEYPAMAHVVACVDTAMSTSTMADWSAMTVWGLWYDHRNRPKLMLMEAWRARLEFNDLVNGQSKELRDVATGKTRRIDVRYGVIPTCRRHKVDRLLVEAKANGISVVQEIRRLCGPEEWGTTAWGRKEMGDGDKVARAYPVQHLLENGLIYAPDRQWASDVISECAQFPRGSHDDYVDNMIMGLQYFRSHGMLLTSEERDDDLSRQLGPRGERKAPYDV